MSPDISSPLNTKSSRATVTGETCIPLELAYHTRMGYDRISISATRRDHWRPEHNHVPAKRLELVQPCCRYIARALILLPCCLFSIVKSNEVANFSSILNLLILTVRVTSTRLCRTEPVAPALPCADLVGAASRRRVLRLCGGQPFIPSQ
jgi:hypothetical protein